MEKKKENEKGKKDVMMIFLQKGGGRGTEAEPQPQA